MVFAEQNLIGDPPFIKLDLICCRNVLIYLKPEIQEKVVALFHFALVDGGCLFLGSSETIVHHQDVFQTVDKRWRIFRRVGPTRHDQFEIPLAAGSVARRQVDTPPSRLQREDLRMSHLAQQHLLDWLSPSAILVDANWHILYICGDVDTYLTHAPGRPNDNVLDKCRRRLRTKLRGAIHQAIQEKQAVTFGRASMAMDKRGMSKSPSARSVCMIAIEIWRSWCSTPKVSHGRAGRAGTPQAQLRLAARRPRRAPAKLHPSGQHRRRMTTSMSMR